MKPNYEQKYHALNRLVGKITLQLEAMKSLIEATDVEVESLVLDEEKPPHDSNHESGR